MKTIVLFHFGGVVERVMLSYGYTCAYVTTQALVISAAGVTHTEALNVFQFIFKVFSSQN